MSRITFAFSILLFLTVIIACSLVALSTITFFADGKLTFFITTLKASMVISPILLLLTMTFGNFRHHHVNNILYSVVIFWVPILMYLFLASAVLTFIYVAAVALGISLPLEVVLTFSLAIIVLFIVLGIVQAWYPKAVSYTIASPILAPLWHGKKIVVVSDVHLGMVRREKFMQKVVTLINEQNPDIVFIAGDLLDGPVIPYEKALAPLGGIKSTFGVYYTAGNHDEYNREQERYYRELEKYVTVLNDAKTTINGTDIVGLIFAHEKTHKTAERLTRAGYENKDRPTIAILHDPKNAAALADAGVSLIVSGHTHSGQFFPISIFVKALYKEKAKGVYRMGNTAAFTSVGVGTAGPLFRLGTQPEIAVLTIE